jgi:hypothetical protein
MMRYLEIIKKLFRLLVETARGCALWIGNRLSGHHRAERRRSSLFESRGVGDTVWRALVVSVTTAVAGTALFAGLIVWISI